MKKLIELIIAASILMIFAYAISQYIYCNKSGGTFVRGVFWFECIK